MAAKTVSPHATLIKTLNRRADGLKAVAQSYDKQIDEAYEEVNALATEQSSHYSAERVLRDQIAALESL